MVCLRSLHRFTPAPAVTSAMIMSALVLLPGTPVTAQDNGRDVNWEQAQAHCRGLGGGWSLPTVQQLQSLYNANLPRNSCGAFTCKVSDQFRLSSYWFWSSEPNGSSEAWIVLLGNGDRFSLPVGYRDTTARALCVRRP